MGKGERNAFEQSHSSQVEGLGHMHVFVWVEISFPWVRWMIIAPKVSQKKMQTSLPQQSNCLPSARDLA